MDSFCPFASGEEMPAFDDKTWAAIFADKDMEIDAPATPSAIYAFESQHDFLLPDAHREFLLRGNGGVVGYVRLFGVGRKDALDLARQLSEMRSYIEGMSEGPVFPFASEWGGSYYCYDLRKSPSGKGYPVLFWNHEYSEEPDDLPMVWSVFAADFVEFIKKVTKV
jgi:hypothetical protein